MEPSKPVRLFVAIDAPKTVREAVVAWTSRLDLPAARWVAPDKLHLTLCFVGKAPAKEVESALSGLQVPTLNLSLEGWGCFPSRGRATVLWLGLNGDVEALTSLASEIAKRIRTVAPDLDDRPYRPHLTVARFRSPEKVSDLPPFDPTEFRVSEVVLYESRLGRGGSVYETLATFG